jgi:hypothetical protein
MNFGNLLSAFDALMALRDTARKFMGGPPPDQHALPSTTAVSAIGNQIETRLTNVVVAALKEAFDRDHARLELERAQMEEQRRRAEEAMRMELRRQAADRELGRLRLLAGTALVGWVASVALLVARLGAMNGIARGVMALGWFLLLGALAAAFTAQGRVGGYAPNSSEPLAAAGAGALAVWLLIAGLGVSAVSLLV